MKTKYIIFIILGIIGLMFLGVCGRYCNDASETVFKETKASTVLVRYEWFKDAYNQLQAKKADIEVQKATIAAMDKKYVGVKPNDWSTADVNNYNTAVQALAGIKMSYNSLAAEYNSNMSKVNYVFCKPTEGREALPQEFKTE